MKVFSREKVEVAVKSMAPLKASGDDDFFLLYFFKNTSILWVIKCLISA